LKKLLLVLSLLLTVSSVQADEMNCLVEALYHEARSEEIVPMIAVGNVIMERVRSERFPNTVCEVVHQGKYWKYAPILNQCQFSYWCDGKPEKFNDMEALYKSMEVASMVFQGIVLKQTMGATHYHASYVRPFWSLSSRFKLLEQVGTHLFYIDIKK
jgi:spore germination cell wall hydrolase CwlJ-like protein